MKIIKAPGATRNTWLTEIKGSLADARKMTMQSRNYDVFFTSDTHGESLSITLGNKQIQLPFELVEMLIEKARKESGVK